MNNHSELNKENEQKAFRCKNIDNLLYFLLFVLMINANSLSNYFIYKTFKFLFKLYISIFCQ